MNPAQPNIVYLDQKGRDGRFVGINLDNITSEGFAKIKGKLKNVRDHILYDSLRFTKATAWAPQTFPMFSIPVGQQTSVANVAATTYLKTQADTNLVGQGGALPNGDFFTVQSIMV